MQNRCNVFDPSARTRADTFGLGVGLVPGLRLGLWLGLGLGFGMGLGFELVSAGDRNGVRVRISLPVPTARPGVSGMYVNRDLYVNLTLTLTQSLPRPLPLPCA